MIEFFTTTNRRVIVALLLGVLVFCIVFAVQTPLIAHFGFAFVACYIAPIVEECAKRSAGTKYAWLVGVGFGLIEAVYYMSTCGMGVFFARMVIVALHAMFAFLPLPLGVIGHALWNNIVVRIATL